MNRVVQNIALVWSSNDVSLGWGYLFSRTKKTNFIIFVIMFTDTSQITHFTSSHKQSTFRLKIWVRSLFLWHTAFHNTSYWNNDPCSIYFHKKHKQSSTWLGNSINGSIWKTRLMPRVLVLTLTSVEGLKVSDELDILINGRLFRVDRAPEHVATEL